MGLRRLGKPRGAYVVHNVACTHWEDCGVDGGGCCGIGEYERPSFGVCLTVCEKNTHPPARGLGDTLERGIKRLTRGRVKPCEGCKKRRDALNRLMPYRGDDGD